MEPIEPTKCMKDLATVACDNAQGLALVDRCLGYLQRRYFAYFAGAVGVVLTMLLITIAILVQQIRVLSMIKHR